MGMKVEANEEMILDCNRKQTIVIEANAQGIFELTYYGRRLTNVFPEAVDKFRKLCMEGKVFLGQHYYIKHGDYNLVFIVTQQYAVGKKKDALETTINMTKQAVKNFLDTYSLGKPIVSGYLISKAVFFKEIRPILTRQKLQWLVYME